MHREVKRCSCEQTYSLAQWNALKLVGYQDVDGVRLELRQCSTCGSTIAIPESEAARYLRLQARAARHYDSGEWQAFQADLVEMSGLEVRSYAIDAALEG
jgi:hypothetical protein